MCASLKQRKKKSVDFFVVVVVIVSNPLFVCLFAFFCAVSWVDIDLYETECFVCNYLFHNSSKVQSCTSLELKVLCVFCLKCWKPHYPSLHKRSTSER